ncbi:glucan endo-1 3-beta-glucosidase 5 [Prunus yedoensis var. nudiflora]|uniref:glucan endo-1,3-beta-D-glucosidase n=1 Tax=Prunus yedoensis var. nudiflora TaxID=2094558 RepID=A0A314YI72_PRUYE|nr:glucan endo-1 3-beta-glucosidase 5 [Prunus yedoensis var. nudiflora]
MGLLKAVGFRGLTVALLFFNLLVGLTVGIGVNWGTQLTHPLPPATVVKMLKDNGIQKVKLFDADSSILNALSKSGIQVMVGIPNEMLYALANSVKAAENWVSKNVSSHVSNGVDIRYAAVGNEPLLSTYNGTFLPTIFPALQNVQSALIKAGVSNQVKVTIPINADVYDSSGSDMPSNGDFRPDTKDLMVEIVKFLSDNGAAFTVNIYPFISLYNDANFPADYAFFNGYSSSINDNGKIYNNVFDANHDTLVWALQKNGFGNLSIIVGEIGWPTDGDRNANLQYAQRFNQGFMSHIKNNAGTPMRPGPVDAYLFSLIDEDAKSIQPAQSRHDKLKWISSSKRRTISGQEMVCSVTSASLDDPQVALSVSYACANADCTSLGYGTSCGNLDIRGNISYAFNSYYQINNQLDTACKFPNLSVITTSDPSSGDCKFRIMIRSSSSSALNAGAGSVEKPSCLILFVLVSVFFFTIL